MASSSSSKRPLTWRGWIVPAGALLLGVTGILLAKLLAPELSLVAPRYAGPPGGVLQIDRQGGPRPLTVGAPFVSGSLLEVGEKPAQFTVDRGGSITVAPGSRLRFLNGQSSTTLELEDGLATLDLQPETATTIVSTQVGSLHATDARFTIRSRSPADEEHREQLKELVPDLPWPEILAKAERELVLVDLERGRLELHPRRGPAREAGRQVIQAPARFLLAPGVPLTPVSGER